LFEQKKGKKRKRACPSTFEGKNGGWLLKSKKEEKTDREDQVQRKTKRHKLPRNSWTEGQCQKIERY